MNNNFFVIADVSPGKLNALVKNIMKQTGAANPNEAVRMVNAGEVRISVIKKEFTEKDGTIHFSVTSDGTTGEQWIDRLASKGFDVNNYAKSVLRSKDFKPTRSVTSEIAVLKAELFDDDNRTTRNIRKKAKKRKLTKPNAEVACLIREKFSNEELKAMGLVWIITMHEAIKDFDGAPALLGISSSNNVSRIGTSYDRYIYKWPRHGGFAFVVSQVSNF